MQKYVVKVVIGLMNADQQRTENGEMPSEASHRPLCQIWFSSEQLNDLVPIVKKYFALDDRTALEEQKF